MFNFIKNIFISKEKIGLPLDSIESWFEQRTSRIYNEYSSKIKELNEKIWQEIKKVKENTQKLTNAKLRNEKIPIKEVQFMEGSREFYNKRILLFIESIQIPETITSEFVEHILNEINELGKTTFKAYQILQHFLADESYAIAQNIKNLDIQFNKLKEVLADKKIIEIQGIKQGIKDLKDTIKKEKEIKKQMKELENKVIDLEEDKKNISYELVKKEKSKEFRDYNTSEVEQHKINEQINELKEEMHHYFAVLEHALKKQSKIDISYEDLINKYLTDPINTLLEDKNLDILIVMQKIEDNIRNNVIELKDKKSEKTLETIKYLDRIKILEFLDEYNQFISDFNSIKEKIKTFVILKEIDEIKEKLEEKDEEIWDVNNEISKLNDEFSKININQMKTKIIERINNLLEIDLMID